MTSVLMMSCGTSQEVTEEQKERLEQLVQNKSFEFDAQFARPLATNSLDQLSRVGLLRPGDNRSQIDVRGSTSYLRFKGDTVSADLPYFGERQMGGGYNTDIGINFEGVPENLKVSKNKKGNYTFKFDIRNNSESYDVTLTIFPNLKSSVNINSSQRFSIRYDGDVMPTKNTKE